MIATTRKPWVRALQLLLVLIFAVLIITAVRSCASNADLPVAAGTGPEPALPPPKESLVPLVHIAKATTWPEDVTPDAADGLAVNAYAAGLDHPRWLYLLPNGDVLAAESNAPETEPAGLIGRVENWVKKRAGAGGKSADRISLLRDADGDGVAEVNSVLLSGLTSPFGMSLVDGRLYVANTDRVVSFPYSPGDTSITAAGSVLLRLPAGDLNRHWTRNLVARRDGKHLYVAIGSNSDHAENGIEQERGRAAIWHIDIETGAHRVFASGLRNPVGTDFEPATGTLWTAVNERDDLGGDLVPD